MIMLIDIYLDVGYNVRYFNPVCDTSHTRLQWQLYLL